MIKKQTHYTATLIINCCILISLSSCFQTGHKLAMGTGCGPDRESSQRRSTDNIPHNQNKNTKKDNPRTRSSASINLPPIPGQYIGPTSCSSTGSNNSINLGQNQIYNIPLDAQSTSTYRSCHSNCSPLQSNESLYGPSQQEGLAVDPPLDQPQDQAVVNDRNAAGSIQTDNCEENSCKQKCSKLFTRKNIVYGVTGVAALGGLAYVAGSVGPDIINALHANSDNLRSLEESLSSNDSNDCVTDSLGKCIPR